MSSYRIIWATSFCNFDSLFMLWEVHIGTLSYISKQRLGGYMNYNIV